MASKKMNKPVKGNNDQEEFENHCDYQLLDKS